MDLSNLLKAVLSLSPLRTMCMKEVEFDNQRRFHAKQCPMNCFVLCSGLSSICTLKTRRHDITLLAHRTCLATASSRNFNFKCLNNLDLNLSSLAIMSLAHQRRQRYRQQNSRRYYTSNDQRINTSSFNLLTDLAFELNFLASPKYLCSLNICCGGALS